MRGCSSKSVTDIAATLSDNRILMERDPGYAANLMALPTVERAAARRQLAHTTGGRHVF